MQTVISRMKFCNADTGSEPGCSQNCDRGSASAQVVRHRPRQFSRPFIRSPTKARTHCSRRKGVEVVLKQLDVFGARLLAGDAQRQKGKTWRPSTDTGALHAALIVRLRQHPPRYCVRLFVIASVCAGPLMWIGSALTLTRQLYHQEFGPRHST